MARADLLMAIVRAGARGEQQAFRQALEALIAEERAKQHHVLADRLAAHLVQNGPTVTPAPISGTRNGQGVGLFHEIEPRRQFEDLILTDGVTRACRELVEEQNRADLLRANNLEPRHSVLLAGAPGNGKTSLAEVLATELGIAFLVVRYEGVIGSYLGETAVRLSRLFEQVRQRRCVLFLDEFDVIGKERGDIHETGEIKRVVSSLLLQVDALPSYVVVVTATNHPELLDRAVWRRFQLRLELKAPSSGQVAEWFERFEKRLGCNLGHSPSVLAKRMGGLSFSEIEQFGLDVQRRHILALPNDDVRKIVSDCLKQWKARFSLSQEKSKSRRSHA